MESTSLPGRVQVSRSTYERVYDLGFEFEEESVDVKGKGLCKTYLVKEKHHTNPILLEEPLLLIEEQQHPQPSTAAVVNMEQQ